MVAVYVDTKPAERDTLMTARRVNTGLYRFVRLGWATFTGLRIRCPKGRGGSTPALGTTTISYGQRVNELIFAFSFV